MFKSGQILFHEPGMSALMYINSTALLYGERMIEGTEEGILGITKGFDACANQSDISPANFGELCGMVAGIKLFEPDIQAARWLNLNESFSRLCNWHADIAGVIKQHGFGIETYAKVLEYSGAYYNFRRIDTINLNLL